VTNHSAGGLDVLPAGFSVTISQPQVLPLAHATPEGVSGVALQATTIKPGQELRGTVYFRQERLYVRPAAKVVAACSPFRSPRRFLSFR